jgi:hypothetical protein
MVFNMLRPMQLIIRFVTFLSNLGVFHPRDQAHSSSSEERRVRRLEQLVNLFGRMPKLIGSQGSCQPKLEYGADEDCS